MGMKARRAAVGVTGVVFDEFEKVFHWRPEDTAGLKIGEYLAKPVCARLGVACPDAEWPVAFDVFVGLLGLTPAPAPAPARAAGRLPETCSAGGPVIAIPSELAAQWRGVEGGEGTNDYERACDHAKDKRPTEYGAVGWVPVGDGAALVLDLELMTTATHRDGAIVIIRNYSGEASEALAEELIRGVDDGAWSAFPRQFRLAEGRLFLFDSACVGAAEAAAIFADDGVAVAEGAPGTYQVDIAVKDGLDFIRLRPV